MKATLRNDLFTSHEMPLVGSAILHLPYIPLDQMVSDVTQEFEAFQPRRLEDREYSLILVSVEGHIILANGIDFDLTN